jgi:hypothetical protein
MLPDGGGVPGGQGCIAPGPQGAPCGGMRLPPLELRGGCRNRRCPAWLVHADIV